jgi:uncharacterized protein (DUF1330 family)
VPCDLSERAGIGGAGGAVQVKIPNEVAAYDAYRMAAESLLARRGLRATGRDGSHMAVEDAVSAQFAADIPAFAEPTFERLRRIRHSAQYFDLLRHRLPSR